MAGKWKDNTNSYKYVTVLGSTGSIGINTLKVIERLKDRFRVFGLSAGKNIKLLREQIKHFKPSVVAVENKELCNLLKSEYSDKKIAFMSGIDGIAELAGMREDDIVVSAISGAAGLLPTFSAIRRGKRVALANKESMVIAGTLMVKEVKKHSAELIPVDSEHSAIFQSINGKNSDTISRILLTASGGPFFNTPLSELKKIKPENALKHPKWKMGKKITIDSATLMNKALEIIEARWLFGVPAQNIEVIIHPECIIHSMVEFSDGSIIGQFSLPDMRTPIAYALTYPERRELGLKKLNLTEIGELHFAEPDRKKFPSIDYAYSALRECNHNGGTMPAVLNASNEIAVNAFLNGEINFLDIYGTIEYTMKRHKSFVPGTIEDVLEADRSGREVALEYIKKIRRN
jgi:1-deoxy-D-xylulose-5-phosphate reductoisomerase